MPKGDEGALRLFCLSKLKNLNLGGTKVTEIAVYQLLKLPALDYLNIWQAQAEVKPINNDLIRSGLTLVK